MKIDPGFCERLVSLAAKGGAEMAEVFMKSSKLLTVEVKDGEVDALEAASSAGFGLRVIKNGRLGFYSSTDIKDPESAVKAALNLADFTAADEYLDLPMPQKPEHPDVFDQSIAGISEEDAIESARLIEQGAFKEDKRIKRIRKALASFSSAETLIVNSKGVSFSYPSTFCTAHITAVAEDGGDSRMGWDFMGGRFLSEVSFENVGRGAAHRALRMLGSRHMSTERASVVLEGSVATEFLSVFASMLSSESVQKGKSLLKGRVGQKVISGSIDIIDDGLLHRGPGTRPVDDEGFPAMRNELIEEGTLKGFMYNTHTAKKEGGESTGNAVRGRFSAVPGIGPMNLYIAASKKTTPLAAMLSSIESGLFVTEAMGIHTANPVSGDFSIGVSGLKLKNGAVEHPVKEAVISGNLLEFFRHVEAVGDDLRFYGNIGSPSLLVASVDISA